jgi:hexosaminidase
MKKFRICFILLFFMRLLNAMGAPGLVPQPNQIQVNSGNFSFNDKTNWIVENSQQQKITSQLVNDFSTVAGYVYKVKTGKGNLKNSVVFVTNPTIAVEAYKINVSASTIRIEASSASGFFYSMQTLRQLLPPQINSGRYVPQTDWTVPCVNINDAPRFGYRGFMLDVSRYFMPKKDLLRLINLLAFHKINYFHWHLVDDNGWRIEIKKYPRLTDVSAWRVDRENLFSMRTNPEQGEATTQGGYYTQEDIREIVKYAQDRCIEIIPEIEMPAHTNSSLAAYPNLACPVVDHFIGVLPGTGGKNASTIYCAGNDSVFTFLKDVLNEVIQLFPSKYIHIGGDEANKDNWKKCSKCQARMKENNIPNEEELQSYFIKRINNFLLKKEKQLMGWDELVDSKIPKNAVIMGWRGMGLDAEKAGEKGFKYIKSPALKYYFIRYQGPQWFEPYTYFGNTTLKDVYNYEPKALTIPDSVSHNMLGIESCLWTEFVNSPTDAEYLIFPRLAAFAEAAWTQPENKNWANFAGRIDKVLPSYNYLGINYSMSMFNIEHVVRPTDRKLTVQLNSIRPDVEIRYTTDDSEPKNNSTLYKEVFTTQPEKTIRACTFMNGVRAGAILPLHIISHKAIGAPVISKQTNAYVLTNGIRGTEKITDSEWLDFYDTDGEFTIDLGDTTMCSNIQLGMLNNAGMGIHFPAKITINASIDGKTYFLIYQKDYSLLERFQNGLFKSTEKYTFATCNIRYLRFQVQNPGICPPTLVREGQKTRMAFDEVLVN